MQIPFEFDPPKKDEDSSLKSKESDLPDSYNHISLQAKKPLTVTQLTKQIMLLLEGEFRSLSVEGELSNVKKAASGHWYFSLKDCLLYTSPSPRDTERSRMPSSA